MTLVPLRGVEPARAASAGPEIRWERDWASLGRCSAQDPDALFVEGKEQRLAKVVCRGCPVAAGASPTRRQPHPVRVWGRMTEQERGPCSRPPHITDWTALLQAMRRGRGPVRTVSDIAGRSPSGVEPAPISRRPSVVDVWAAAGTSVTGMPGGRRRTGGRAPGALGGLGQIRVHRSSPR